VLTIRVASGVSSRTRSKGIPLLGCFSLDGSSSISDEDERVWDLFLILGKWGNLNIVTTEGGAIVMWGGTLRFILEGRYLDESGDVGMIKNGQGDQLFWVKEDLIVKGKELKREFRNRTRIRCKEDVRRRWRSTGINVLFKAREISRGVFSEVMWTCNAPILGNWRLG
jgi:hypothetical protein